jgi:hypothetical protein
VAWMFIWLSDTSTVLVREMALAAPPEIVPPELLFAVPPPPVTVRPPLVPVLSSTIPVAVPPAEMLSNSRLPTPIVVLATSSAVAVVVVKLLPVPVALTVPPPVAMNAVSVPVDMVMVPEKLTAAPALPLRNTPRAAVPAGRAAQSVGVGGGTLHVDHALAVGLRDAAAVAEGGGIP